MRDHRSLSLLLVWSAVLLATHGFVIPGGRLSRIQQIQLNERGSAEDHSQKQDDVFQNPSRRSLLLSLPFVLSTLTVGPQPARADLIQFPCKDGTLRNTYHFMRAGQSKLEEQDVWGTNPLFLTNRENALSDLGVAQVQDACRIMEEAQLNLSLVKFSLAANAMDTSDIVAQDLQVGRNQLVPEYTYMDQRGIGKWDMLTMQSTQDAVWAMDANEAGKEGWGGLPPPHDDGTANEMLGNQVTRLRQLISLLESMCSGDSILLIFPDGTGPALLSCLMAGIPLRRVHELTYSPGEVRLDVKYSSIRAMLPTTPTPEYTEAIQRGTKQLRVLRTNPQDLVNVKDQLYAQEEAKERAKNAASKEADRKRQEAAEEERDRRYDSKLVPVNDKDFMAAELGALGLAAGAFGVWTHESSKEQEDGEVATGNITPIDKQEHQPVEGPTRMDNENYPELQTMEGLIETGPFSIPGFGSEQGTASTVGLYDDAGVVSDQERVEIAEQAMENYMNQDDGGDAFLGMLEELMNEEEEAF